MDHRIYRLVTTDGRKQEPTNLKTAVKAVLAQPGAQIQNQTGFVVLQAPKRVRRVEVVL